ncbi:hypothetical protein HZC32_02190 [Candidatus Woesearchaeota archaeon]|nr:hypothetical protein [Candidatus Woesearchaeota archaeon]
MEEKMLYKVSTALIIAGIIILFLYAEEFDLKGIESIETVQPQEPIKISGTITKLTPRDKALFLEIEGNRVEKTDVIVFSSEPLFLQKGDFVEVYGTTEEYKGTKEVIASKVIKK